MWFAEGGKEKKNYVVVEPLVGPSCLRAEIESKKGETGREKPYEGIQTK